MSPVLEQAVRNVLDHGRKTQRCVVIPAADYDALAGCFATKPARPRDPAYDREMCQLFANAELDP